MKGRIKLNKDNKIEIEYINTFGICNNTMISHMKIGKNNYTVLSLFEKDQEFTDAMEKVIKKQLESA